MKRIALTEHLKTHSQAKVARELNVTQAAISKAVQAQRDIYLVVNRKGVAIKGEEVRPFPHQQ